MELAKEWDKTFPRSEKVDHQKVTFTNRFGVTLAGDLYQPENRADQRLPALAVSGPFGAVKEQSSGLYAQTMAERGFVDFLGRQASVDRKRIGVLGICGYSGMAAREGLTGNRVLKLPAPFCGAGWRPGGE